MLGAGMCEWKNRSPDLKPSVQSQQHHIGFPAFLIDLKMATQLLCSPELQNVAIIVSDHLSGKGEDVESANCSDNDMKKWVNVIVFGDGAAAVFFHQMP